VSARLAIVATAADAALAGLEGEFEWGAAAVVAPGADPVGDADVVVALGDAVPGGDRAADVRFVGESAAEAGAPRSAAIEGGSEAAGPGARLIATAGEDLWSRAPWPVRDDIFDLPPAPAGSELVVVAADDLDPRLLDKLAGRGIPARHVTALTATDLATAVAVAFPPAPDADGAYLPGGRVDALPPLAFAALAASRPLILPRARTTFGLLPGSDHLAASSDDEVVQWADALRAEPPAFAGQIALGRIAAETQRASTVYGRLVEELAP
jgi:hypothetical protein